ncbi:dihydrolipoyl dehydrogenase [bacterium]|nr:dihydrolipoyl dehydrogenase [bacterium]
MNATAEYDVIIIGSGPGGYVAGIRAAQLGLRACVIEKDKPGGICLNVGCIPTKSLIHQAGIFLSRSELERMGVAVDTGGFDYHRVYEKSRKAADMLSMGVQYLLKKNNVPLIHAAARIVSPRAVSLDDGSRIEGKNIIIATGSRPLEIPGFPFDEDRVLTSTGALFLQELPRRLIILGAGAVGCEFAYIMNAFGVEVCLVEMMNHILPREDDETVAVLERSFRRKGISALTGTRAHSLEKSGGTLSVSLENTEGNKKTVETDKVLVVAGRTPNTDGIGLEDIGIDTVKGFIPVGDYYLTAADGVFAIGDVVSTPLLAHVASREAEITVEYIAGLHPEPALDPLTIPSAVYTEPQIGSFGMTESDAQRNGVAFRKAVFPYKGSGKAVAIERTDGFVKVLYNPETKDILGAHIVGHNATELIHELLLARASGLKSGDITSMIHAHPTLSEMVLDVMRAVEGRSINV